MIIFRKVLKDIEEKTPRQYENLSMNEVFVFDNRNTINKLKYKNIGRLQGLQIGLLQESIRYFDVTSNMKIIVPLKEYNQTLKIRKKYDNNIKY